jgi:hypothetical protein
MSTTIAPRGSLTSTRAPIAPASGISMNCASRAPACRSVAADHHPGTFQAGDPDAAQHLRDDELGEGEIGQLAGHDRVHHCDATC